MDIIDTKIRQSRAMGFRDMALFFLSRRPFDLIWPKTMLNWVGYYEPFSHNSTSIATGAKQDTHHLSLVMKNIMRSIKK